MTNFQWRMAELTTLQKKRELTEAELNEVAHCLQLNASYAWRLAELYNLSLLASMTDDTEELHRLCAEIDKLKIKYGAHIT